MEYNKCPFCNQPYSLGYIKTRGSVICWSLNKKKKSFFSSRWSVEEKDIKLGTYRFLTDEARIKAYRCDKCKKIIIDEDDCE